jgi:hypothetical protein
MTRLVGLSATLPNHADVGAFLRVGVGRGLFHFDAAWVAVAGWQWLGGSGCGWQWGCGCGCFLNERDWSIIEGDRDDFVKEWQWQKLQCGSGWQCGSGCECFLNEVIWSIVEFVRCTFMSEWLWLAVAGWLHFYKKTTLKQHTKKLSFFCFFFFLPTARTFFFKKIFF